MRSVCFITREAEIHGRGIFYSCLGLGFSLTCGVRRGWFLGSFVQGQEAGQPPSFLPLSTGPPASRWRRLWKLLSDIGGTNRSYLVKVLMTEYFIS